MLRLRQPSPGQVQEFMDRQREQPFSYKPVGATTGTPPAGFVVDHTRVELGEGDAVFDAAKQGLENWDQFRLGWLAPGLPRAVIEPGQTICLLAKSIGLWWLNACRIIYILDESDSGVSPSGARRRFGFAYGTLPAHAACGEERFLIEMDDQRRVWYDILAFSRPQHFLAKIGYPYVRVVQKRFGKDSARQVHSVVNCRDQSAAGSAF